MKASNEDFQLIPSDFTTQNLSSHVTSQNSFLVEIDRDYDISDTLRQEINQRYIKSKANRFYKFPRVDQSSSFKLKQSIYKFSVARPSKKTIFSKRDCSYSPYSLTLNKTRKSKSPNKNDSMKNSKTPIPDKSYSKLKYSSRLPKILKVKSDVKKPIRFTTLMK